MSKRRAFKTWPGRETDYFKNIRTLRFPVDRQRAIRWEGGDTFVISSIPDWLLYSSGIVLGDRAPVGSDSWGFVPTTTGSWTMDSNHTIRWSPDIDTSQAWEALLIEQ